jgi:exopolyphosphatase/guanosine-5'-triphosphate,3'-diphosphate pyrophosphatase
LHKSSGWPSDGYALLSFLSCQPPSKNDKQLQAISVKEMQKEMVQLSVEERMKKYNIKKDRAEVIVPALQIYNSIFKWCNIEQILVPKIGLADGLIQHLYDIVLKEN